MAGEFQITPINSLNHLTETQHIGCYLKGEAAKVADRLQGYNEWTVKWLQGVKGSIKYHSYINNSFVKELNILKKETHNKIRLRILRSYLIINYNSNDLNCNIHKFGNTKTMPIFTVQKFI